MTTHPKRTRTWEAKQQRRFENEVPLSALEAQLNGAVKGLDYQDEEMVRNRRTSLPMHLRALFDQYIAIRRR